METFLFEVCRRLGEKERAIIELAFKYERSPESKVIKLYKLILDGKLTSDIQLSTYLYGGDKVESKYSHLKAELLYEIMRVFIFSTSHHSIKKSGNLYNRINFSVYHLATETLFFQKEIKLSYMTFDLLLKRTLRDGLNEEFEYLLGLKDKLFSNSIDHDSKNALFQSLESLAKHRFDRTFALGRLKKLTELIESGLYFSDDLKDMKEYEVSYTEDSLIVIYKMRFNVLYYYAIGEFQSSYNKTLKLNGYIKANSKSMSDFGGVQILFAQHYALRFEFEAAVNSYTNARKNFFPKGSNDKSAMLGLARMYLHMRQNDKALLYIVELKNFDLLRDDDYDHIALFEALIEFRMDRYQAALIKIQGCSYFYQFKESWRITIKLFELYMIFNLKLFDIFESKLDAFRKMLFSVKHRVSVRYLIIYKILYYILRNVNKLNLKKGIERRMQALSSLSRHNKWNPIGFEILSFEEWLEKRFSIADHRSKEHLQLYNPSNNTEESANEN